MANFDPLFIIAAAAVFAYLYAITDVKIQPIFKVAMLISCLCLVVLAFISANQLTSTTNVTTSNAINQTTSSTVTYIYTPDAPLNALGDGLGVLAIIVFADFIYRIWRVKIE